VLLLETNKVKLSLIPDVKAMVPNADSELPAYTLLRSKLTVMILQQSVLTITLDDIA
jgi:hypothetical protein